MFLGVVEPKRKKEMSFAKVFSFRLEYVLVYY